MSHPDCPTPSWWASFGMDLASENGHRYDAAMVEVAPARTEPSPLRRFVEVATRNVILRSHLPEKYGRRPIYISPGNALRFLKPGDAKFDPILLWMVDKFVKPGTTVWDIGANGGVFSALAATVAKTVVAFEPDPFNVALIDRTRKANPDLDIRLCAAALSDRSGEIALNIPQRGRSVASIDGIPMGGESGGLRNSVTVQTKTADQCLDEYPHPSFIKCDIEGAEALLLEGATRLLSEVRPVICMEVRDTTADDVAAAFRRHSYTLHSSDDEMRALDDIRDACDVIAVPQS